MKYKLHEMTDQIPVLEKLDTFLALESGWHFGEGVATKPEPFRNAKNLVERALMSSLSVDVFPGIEGEVMVCMYRGADYLEFTFETNGTVTYLRELGDSEVELCEGLSLADASRKFDAFQEELCLSISELSIETTTTQQKRDSKAWHLKIPQMGGSLVSKLTASIIWKIISVDTSESYMYQGRQMSSNQFSGASQCIDCREAA